MSDSDNQAYIIRWDSIAYLVLAPTFQLAIAKWTEFMRQDDEPDGPNFGDAIEDQPDSVELLSCVEEIIT